MPAKEFTLESGTIVKIYKRKGSRNLRLSVSAAGIARVTIPSWVPYKAGLEFAKSRDLWLRQNLPERQHVADNQAIGKAHRIRFVKSANASKPYSRLSSNTVNITYPLALSEKSTEVQAIAIKASIRALRAESQQLLPIRLKDLANTYNFKYASVSIKRLKGRWGSCDSNANIVLNLYIIQLPWDLIDYVLLHELTHTNILRHGPDFWASMEKVLPNPKSYKKRLRTYQPALGSPS